MKEENLNLSNIISVNVTNAKGAVLTVHGFIESFLRMGYGPRCKDAERAFEMLGGLGFSAKRKKRRLSLLKVAREIAAHVGHGDEVEPMRVIPDIVYVPLDHIEQVKILFGEGS